MTRPTLTARLDANRTPAVFYGRVSTQRQGKSGLGLAAQREGVLSFALANNYAIEAEYREVETGKGHDALDRRPQLRAALDHAKKIKGPIIVAKLDRLGRDVHFISGLMASRVPFIVTQLGPNVDPFMLHIYAAMAEQERALISNRTREALRAAKRRGTQLGRTGKDRAEENRKAAVDRAAALAGLVSEIRASGITSVREIANELNRRDVRSARGGTWHPTAVARLLRRIP